MKDIFVLIHTNLKQEMEMKMYELNGNKDSSVLYTVSGKMTADACIL